MDKIKKQNLKYYLSGAVALMTFIVYLASLQNDFVEWDDSQYVYENLHIRAFDLDFFRWSFFEFYAANWHPLTWISHALDYAVWGLNPLGHHLTNNILHALNTFLVVLLVARLIEAASILNSPYPPLRLRGGAEPEVGALSSGGVTPSGAGASRFGLIAAATTGLLFGLHPLHVESVAWVAERKDLLCALFYLLSIMAYMKYAGSTSHGAKGIGHSEKDNMQSVGHGAVYSMRYALAPMLSFKGSLLFALCFFVLALMSKPMAVSLPVVLLLLDWYPFNRIISLKTFRTALTEKLPFIALSILSSILTILAQRTGESVVAIETIPLSTRTLVSAKSLVAYLWKMIVPLHLIPYYPYPNDASLFSIEYLAGIILVVMITAVCIVMAKKQKRLFLSVWTYYILTLIPVLGLVQVGGQSMADRYTYLPGIGPFLIIGLPAAWIMEKTQGRTLFMKYTCAATALFLLLAISLLTWKQIEVWKDTFSLWTYVTEKEPVRVPLAYNNRGLAFYRKGQSDQAIEDFNKAIILDPVSFKAYLNRGAAFVNKGQFDQAEADFDKAIALNPSYPEAHNAKGSLFGMSGSLDKAIEQFSRAIEINPGYSAAYGNRGAAYSLIGRNDKALEDLDEAIRLDRYYTENYLARGNVHLATGSKELAVSDFRRACDLGNKSGCDAMKSFGKAATN